MKTRIAVVLATFLSVVSATAQQKYLLPIGNNVNTREMKFYLGIGDADTGSGYVNRQVIYTPQSSKTLQEFLVEIAQEMAKEYSSQAGTENDTFVLAINSDIGPSVEDKFFNLQRSGSQLVVPPEVLDVKLNYGKNTALRVDGVTGVEMEVRLPDSIERFSSKEGGPGISPCFLGNQQGGLGEGWVLVENTYALPWLQKDRGLQEGSTITLLGNDRFATFNLLDGFLMRTSESPPAFLETLRAPEMPQTPVLVVSSPKITRIARIGNTTEITVSAEATSVAYLEFAESVGGSWNAVPAYPTPLSLKSGSSTFTHTTDALSCFYRLRIAESPKGQ